MTIKELCTKYGISLEELGDVGEISDGYHTFNSLYQQRCILFAALCNTFKDLSWKSRKHSDGEECFGGGWFIVGIDTQKGSYTYHYENEFWDLFKCQELEVAKEWDGHTDKDVERLLSLKKSEYEYYWIPVTERLPKKPKYDWVLVKTEFVPEGGSGVPHVAELRNGIWYCDCCDGPMEDTLGLRVVAWFDMQLIKDAELKPEFLNKKLHIPNVPIKYRKKPVIIEAVRWDGKNHREMWNFLTGKTDDYISSSGDNFYIDHEKVNGGLIIKTLEGEHIASVGDYIIKGIKDEFYPCKPDIFEQTYEEV